MLKSGDINISNIIKRGFDSELVNTEKYIKTKLKSCKVKINKNLYDNSIPKEGSHFIFLSIIKIDSVFKWV